MKKMRQKFENNKGSAALLFIGLMAFFVSLILATTHSRLLLSLRRGQSTFDSLLATYIAESEANDMMARIYGEYLESANINLAGVDRNGTIVDILGSEVENTQTITVTAKRDFAVSRVQAVRKIQSIKNVDSVDIILSLDCTGSMDAGANCDNCRTLPTRFDSQKEAAISFVDQILNTPEHDKFNLGVSVFGIDAKWLTFNGQDVSPGTFGLSEIKSAISSGFGSTRNSSPACSGVMDSTSVGSAFTFSHDYFSQSKKDRTKQIEIVITDGDPNSRIPYVGCSPSLFCPAFPISTQGENYCENNAYGWQCYNYSAYKDGPYETDNYNDIAYKTCDPLGKDFLRCALATNDKIIPELGYEGVRDPEVDAYAVTIFNNPPAEAVSIFRNYTTENGYFNAARASQLKNILNTIFNEILRERSVITIRRLIPN